jgi:hypothetical protein
VSHSVYRRIPAMFCSLWTGVSSLPYKRPMVRQKNKQRAGVDKEDFPDLFAYAPRTASVCLAALRPPRRCRVAASSAPRWPIGTYWPEYGCLVSTHQPRRTSVHLATPGSTSIHFGRPRGASVILVSPRCTSASTGRLVCISTAY